ncbi:MAG: plasmid pRiA4b ORF-3 family protein [Gammaproteobacteria bacterium]|nr:plasmid pRiA4b ORF-3 family protein [Gammaproteobacteria bacterium]
MAGHQAPDLAPHPGTGSLHVLGTARRDPKRLRLERQSPHEFEVPAGRNVAPSRLGIPMDDDDWMIENDPRPPLLPGWKHRVADYLSLAHPSASYWYDFSDDWRHTVTLEDVLPPAPGKKYPRCTAGERAGPPDDCGGAWGYAELLEVLADPSHHEHASSHRWASSIKGIKGKFDPEAFDEQQVKFDNPARRLKNLLEHVNSD